MRDIDLNGDGRVDFEGESCACFESGAFVFKLAIRGSIRKTQNKVAAFSKRSFP